MSQAPIRDGEAPSQVVVRAVADHVGVAPTELTERLYHVLDPDALDALFEDRGGAARDADVAVSFEFNGCHVTVRGADSVEVRTDG